MKLIVVALLVFLSLSQLCTSMDTLEEEYQDLEPDVVFDDGVPEGGVAGRVTEDDDGLPAHDPTLDQEALVGGQAARKRLTELPKEEAEKEIRKLVERIDTNADGQLDRKELFAWLSRVEDMAFVNEATNVFYKEDTDRDGYVTAEEYLANSGLPEDIPGGAEDVKSVEQDIRKRFEIADKDKDGRLSKAEFGVFVHPDRHDEMMEHLIRDQLNRFDKDSDGKVSLDEYMKHYNPSGKPLDEMPDWVAGEQREFEEKLDVNKDGYLDDSEIRQWIAPSDDEFFNDEIDHLLNHIDENKDDQLSYDEVLAQFDVLVDSPLTDYGHAVHEEL